MLNDSLFFSPAFATIVKTITKMQRNVHRSATTNFQRVLMCATSSSFYKAIKHFTLISIGNATYYTGLWKRNTGLGKLYFYILEQWEIMKLELLYR